MYPESVRLNTALVTIAASPMFTSIGSTPSIIRRTA